MVKYEDALVHSFQGGKAAVSYVSDGEDLGVELRVYESSPTQDAAVALDAACHTVVVVLGDRTLLDQSPAGLWVWVEKAALLADASSGRHGVVILAASDSDGDDLKNVLRRARLQLQYAYLLGEREVRPAMFALQVLHTCRLLIAPSLPKTPGALDPPGFLRLFISHAKMDGLPLAQSLKHQIEELPWLGSFYDARDLRPGAAWPAELERNARSSLLIILRTNIYESRLWCRNEVLWSDECATPAVLVDARTNLQFPSGLLPFDRVPSVRIPDGNLLRILFLAIHESLRALIFVRRIEDMKASGALPSSATLQVFAFAPSMAALLRACREMATIDPAQGPRMIIYPDPPFGRGTHEAAEALVASYAPGTLLMTPFEVFAV